MVCNFIEENAPSGVHNRMKIVKLNVNDVVEMKKKHPCGGNLFKIIRVGSDIRAVCQSCGHDMTIDRIKFEKSIKKIIPFEGEKI